jgi:hypothetical protein
MISGTMFGISAGFSRNLRYSSGCLFSAHNPPLIELRVVSLPPTISSTQFPMNSIGSMFRVASPCASIEIRSEPRGAFTRSFHNPIMAAAIFLQFVEPLFLGFHQRVGVLEIRVATFDQYVRSRRRSNG